jgi:hypothetical protein
MDRGVVRPLTVFAPEMTGGRLKKEFRRNRVFADFSRDSCAAGVFRLKPRLQMNPFALLFLVAGTTVALAQTAPPAASSQRRPPAGELSAPPLAVTGEMKRFDLDFPGGSPRSLVDAIGKSLGKEINAVIDETTGRVLLPPIRVRSATIADIFSAVSTVSRREVTIPSGGGAYQRRVVLSQFVPATGGIAPSDDTVWCFVSNELETSQLVESGTQPGRELRYFQLRQFLADNLTVEDITTAIRTGWEMLAAKQLPDLKFHKETGMLIAAGDPKLLDEIPQVLQNLPHSSAGPGGAGLIGPPTLPKPAVPVPVAK